MRRPCKECGKELLFALNPATGATLPLDVASRSHIYELHDSSEEPVASSAAQQEVYVSHFLTCPKASSFSKAPAKQEVLL